MGNDHDSSLMSFSAVCPSLLDIWLDDNDALLIDIRPNPAYFNARIPSALSISVPSTLLKRPLFNLTRITEMLPSESSRTRFAAWKSKNRILVYDADTATTPNKNSCIHGLLSKFANEGFQGQLCWLQGGFQAVWKERRDIIDTSPIVDEEEDVTPSSSNILCTRHLPSSPFAIPTSSSLRRPNLPSLSRLPTQLPCNPFFDTVRQNVELSHGITERITLRLPWRVRSRIAELPFRWLRDIARRAAPREASDEEEGDAPNSADVEEGTEALAMQFYRIELAEQRRLMGVMEHHSKESGALMVDEEPPAANSERKFPFSITAGVEKGAKNRWVVFIST
jgi:tyrosine-protein phosphatase 2/3